MSRNVFVVILVVVLVSFAGCSGLSSVSPTSTATSSDAPGGSLSGTSGTETGTSSTGGTSTSVTGSPTATTTPAQSGLTLSNVGSLSEYSSSRAFLQATYQQHHDVLKNVPGFTSTIVKTSLVTRSGSIRGASLTNESVRGNIRQISLRADVQEGQYVTNINMTVDPSPDAGLQNLTIRKYTNQSYGYIYHPKTPKKYIYTQGSIEELYQLAKKKNYPPPVVQPRAAGRLPMGLKYANVRYLGKTTLNGQTVYEFVATYNKSGPTINQTTPVNLTMQSFTYRFYVSKDPVVIQRFEYTSYKQVRGKLSVYKHIVFKLTRIGNVTVETPDWIKTPRQKG